MEFIVDTIRSIEYYIHSTYRIILSDDTHNPAFAAEIKQHFPEIIIFGTDQNFGKGLGLYVSLSHVYEFALQQFDFKGLLRLDTDALITGHDPELPALQMFKENPKIGLAGRYIKGKFSTDDLGDVFNNDMGRGRMVQIAKLFTRNFLRYPFIQWGIRKRLFKAIDNGYELGELVFGGAYIFSRTGLEKLRDEGLLPLKAVKEAALKLKTGFLHQYEEDGFFSMLICSAGLKLGDMATGNLPFGCTWIGLPGSPHTLYRAGKKIIHSTRFWKDLKEEEIRQYFRNKRISKLQMG
jgi:hypothetical protein